MNLFDRIKRARKAAALVKQAWPIVKQLWPIVLALYALVADQISESQVNRFAALAFVAVAKASSDRKRDDEPAAGSESFPTLAAVPAPAPVRRDPSPFVIGDPSEPGPTPGEMADEQVTPSFFVRPEYDASGARRNRILAVLDPLAGHWRKVRGDLYHEGSPAPPDAETRA